MDCRAVLIILLTAQAACNPVKPAGGDTKKLNEAIQKIRNNTGTALSKLRVQGLLPNTPCPSLNMEQYVGLQEERITAHSFSSFACYMSQMSERTPDLREELANASEYAQHVKLFMDPTQGPVTCILPTFKEDMNAYEFVRCFLDHLDQRLSQGNF